MVHQECILAQHLTVAENIFLGRQPAGMMGLVNRRSMEQQAAKLIEEHRFPLQADWIVGKLSPAQKQLVEICRAIQAGSSLLIFDEPTSSLSESETKEVFRIVRQLRERGTGVIYITHRLDELRSVGDRVEARRDLVVHRGDDGVLLELRHIVRTEGAEVGGGVLQPAGEGIAADHGRAERSHWRILAP